MTLYTWSWLFLFGYILVMVGFGVLGNRRVGGADDYAVARGGYGPVVLALAFASTAASGATFLGLPGLTYTYGMSTLWIAFLYPVGVYLGILICQRTIGRYGNLSGARSIPEYLGERYRSEALRISAAVLSLILLFYLAGQLVAGLVMFEMMLGLSKGWALTITTAVLLGYVTLGGAHADILTDGAQGLLMVILAIVIVVLFILGVGSGGFSAMLNNLGAQDPLLMQPLHPGAAITASVWSFVSLVIAHIPLGLLPHIGNKLWALGDERARTRFLVMAFSFGLILPAITLGGALARSALGDSLLVAGDGGANTALPALFLEVFPTWLAALLGSAGLAWLVMDMNVVLLVWVGIGGFTATLAGPLVLGSVWNGVTRAGALWGFWTGAVLFVLIHSEVLAGIWPPGTVLESFGRWFDFYATSPYSAATLAGLTAVLVTAMVSCVEALALWGFSPGPRP